MRAKQNCACEQLIGWCVCLMAVAPSGFLPPVSLFVVHMTALNHRPAPLPLPLPRIFAAFHVPPGTGSLFSRGD